MGNRELSRLSQTTIGPNRWIRKSLCNRLTGELNPILGDSYIHDGNKQKGTKSVIFDTDVADPGKYKVKLLYTSHANRASNTPVTVIVGDMHKMFKVDQKQSDGTGFLLGSFYI